MRPARSYVPFLCSWVFNDKRDSQLITETMQEDPYSSEDPNSVWDAIAVNLLHTFRQDTPTL